MAKEYSSNRRSRKSRGSASRQVLVIMLTFLVGYIMASFFDFETISQWVNTQVLAHHQMKKEPAKPQAQAAIPPKPKFEFYTLLANEKGAGSQPSANNTSTATQPAAVANASVTSATPPTTVVATASTAATVKTTVVNGVLVTTATPATAIKSNATSPKAQQPNLAPKIADAKPVAAVGKGTYLVQVASFKARQDAEHMKGTLILKGFSAYIVPVSHASKGNWFRVVIGPYSNRVLAQQAQGSLARNERLNGMITSGWYVVSVYGSCIEDWHRESESITTLAFVARISAA